VVAGGGSLQDYNHAERRLWQDASAILFQIGLKPGDTLADLGCGDGYFSIPAARIVGDSGKIYALDISTEAISDLNASASTAGLKNIQTAVGATESTVLCHNCSDVVLLANVLHDFADPIAALNNASSMLKSGGILANLDWKKDIGQIHGPPFARRFDQAKAIDLLRQTGFKVMSSTLAGRFHYLLIAEVV
jgi:ubiquinone/menaquinone biosynthesis C-methylase UbiE